MNAPERMRILVGEDQPIVCEGIVRILERGGFEVAGTAADALDLVRKARVHHPDVVVTDIQMPPDHTDDGLRAAIQIRAAEPGTGVLVLSQFLEDRYAFDLVAGGARGTGYLLKEKVGNLSLLTDAIRRVASGGSALDPNVVARLVGRKRRAGPLDASCRARNQDLADRGRDCAARTRRLPPRRDPNDRQALRRSRVRTTPCPGKRSARCAAQPANEGRP